MQPASAPSSKLLHAKGTSLHHQLYLALREQILRGDYAPGALIPKEEDLCTRFGVSRITVRRTLADLEALGIVEKRQGRGTFVRADLPVARPAATLNLIESLRRTAQATKAEVLQFERSVPPAAMAKLLLIEEGVPATHAVRLRKVDGTPVMITDAWVPAIDGVRLSRTALQKKPLYEILLEHGVAFGRVAQEITAVAADAAHARWLDVGLGTPLLKLTRLLYDTRQRPVQYLTVVMSPERSRLLMDVAFKDVNTFSAGHIVHEK